MNFFNVPSKKNEINEQRKEKKPANEMNLYYKERRQLKTFLTQITLALPLTPDPPVVSFWKWIWWKDYEVPKNRNLERVSAKNKLFFSPTCTLTAGCTRWGRFFSLPLHREPSGIRREDIATRIGLSC
jgi:hypothetical protein